MSTSYIMMGIPILVRCCLDIETSPGLMLSGIHPWSKNISLIDGWHFFFTSFISRYCIISQYGLHYIAVIILLLWCDMSFVDPIDHNKTTIISWLTGGEIGRNMHCLNNVLDSKIRGANMGPIWGQQDPGGPHDGPMNFAIWGVTRAEHFLNGMISLWKVSSDHYPYSYLSYIKWYFSGQ